MDHCACQPAYRYPPPRFTTGEVKTAVGPIPQVAARLATGDRLGAARVRMNLRRMDYRVAPGLYAVGRPTAA
jgi:hypothetical protein